MPDWLIWRLLLYRITMKYVFRSLHWTDALETVWLSGFYIRPDANGNGIPDCAEEPDDQGETDIAYKSITEHVCVDETTYLGNVRIFVDAQDDKVGTKLTFTCYPYNGNGQKIEQEAELQQDDKAISLNCHCR